MTHVTHGRGSAEDGPDDPDCPCRGTLAEYACAADGCGFCAAAQDQKAREAARRRRR